MEFYTTGDIAKYCGVSMQVTSNWHRRGKLPKPVIVTVGGINLWSGEQVAQIKQARDEREERELKVAALRNQITRIKSGEEQ